MTNPTPVEYCEHCAEQIERSYVKPFPDDCYIYIHTKSESAWCERTKATPKKSEAVNG